MYFFINTLSYKFFLLSFLQHVLMKFTRNTIDNIIKAKKTIFNFNLKIIEKNFLIIEIKILKKDYL